MIHRTISQLSLDSVVFENRNQAYGAFELRSLYNLHLIRSLMIALFFCAGMSGLFYVAHLISNMMTDEVVQPKIISVTLKPIIFSIETPPAQQIEKPAIIKSENVNLSVTPTNTNYVPVDIPEAELVEITEGGHTGGIETGTSGGVIDGTGIETATAIIEPEEVKELPVTFAEVMPKFQGGNEAMFKHLSSNIHYPNHIASQEIEGRVYISFIVNKFGKIENVMVVKGLHPILDAEATRVIQAMPDWTPGLQNGRAVSVKMSIPIYFKLN